jgi:hypothetical protein
MFQTIADIKDANAKVDGVWFSAGTMRWFRSRVSSRIYPLPDGGALFISSEQVNSTPRKYTIRRARPGGTIDTVGAFQAHRTLARAHHHARQFCTHLHYAAARAARTCGTVT